MNEFNSLSISLTVAALLVCLSNIVFTKVQGRMGKRQNRVFMLLLIIVALNAACNTVTAFYRPFRSYSIFALYAANVARYLYFVFHTTLAPLFFFYVASVCGVTFRTRFLRKYLMIILFIITEAIAVLNPLTGWLYYLDNNQDYHRSWGMIAIYVASAIYLVMALSYLTTTWKALTVKRRTGIIMFASIAIAGIIIQMASTELKVELFAEAIGLTGIMIIIENEDDRIDGNTGIYNRQALIMDLNSYIINKNPICSLCVRITTPDIISHKADMDINEIVERAVADYLTQLVKRYHAYRVGPKNFVLIVFEDNTEKALTIASDIVKRFEKPWRLDDSVALLSAAIQVTTIPGSVNTVKDALYMFDSIPPFHSDKKIYSGRDLDYLVRKVAVEKAITNALSHGGFEVYYQPTYNIADMKLHGAEALVRLHNDELGMVFPDEFIPIAEENGLIDAIDDYVLLEVCKLINEEELSKYGVDCINVNLSVSQCLKPGFVEHIKGIVEEAGVDKPFINFEITESLSAFNYEILNEVITSLKKEGFKFSMDDYGTGYSNLRALANMDLDIIKIDKSILWEAEKTDLGEIILENNIRMIHQMNKDILIEGVETESQIELLKPLGVNYLQGFYFSKPVPKDQFLKIVHGQ
ncbi:EAL domain, c-di-GMP-specific phosphodiesterase class I (or its enzymatically inactive variant) [Ruminococcaceae bacterium YRB3002]|nr:EAL domain, c-di-GMP-specific phosphodiesterase class I (or its enzymatically inactive variant) [Ruminococcaceae bacterium YRB3002]